MDGSSRDGSGDHVVTWAELQALAVPRIPKPAREQRPRPHERRQPNQCGDKVRYGSRRAARQAAQTIAHYNSGERRMRAYPCPECHCWHLAHRESY